MQSSGSHFYNRVAPVSCNFPLWNDKTVGQSFTDSQSVEIDHFVPIKNAYISGAWKWPKKMRCVYTNFLGNPMHLIPMNTPENRKKSDNTPEYYMPPAKKYRCEYLFKWLTIKSIWKLALNPGEASAIEHYITSEKCDTQKFFVPVSFINQQRQWITDNLGMCDYNPNSNH